MRSIRDTHASLGQGMAVGKTRDTHKLAALQVAGYP